MPGCCAGVPLDDEGQYGAEAIVNTAAIDVLRRMPVWHPRLWHVRRIFVALMMVFVPGISQPWR